MSPRTEVRLVVGNLTDQGVQRSNNQDYLGRFETPLGDLLIVADGMGGAAGGKTASLTAVNAMRDYFGRHRDAGPEQALAESLHEANRAVFDAAAADSSLKGMGTTVVAVLLQAERFWCAHVGDSRAYLVRADGVRCLTRDHTLIQKLLDEGALSASEAEVHPDRHVLVQCIGARRDVAPTVSAVPVPLGPGEAVVLCSDGLTDLVSDEEIGRNARGSDPQAACQELVRLANERGGHDNVTVQVARRMVVDLAAWPTPPVDATVSISGPEGETAVLPGAAGSGHPSPPRRPGASWASGRRNRVLLAAAALAVVATLLAVGYVLGRWRDRRGEAGAADHGARDVPLSQPAEHTADGAPSGDGTSASGGDVSWLERAWGAFGGGETRQARPRQAPESRGASTGGSADGGGTGIVSGSDPWGTLTGAGGGGTSPVDSSQGDPLQSGADGSTSPGTADDRDRLASDPSAGGGGVLDAVRAVVTPSEGAGTGTDSREEPGARPSGPAATGRDGNKDSSRDRSGGRRESEAKARGSDNQSAGSPAKGPARGKVAGAPRKDDKKGTQPRGQGAKGGAAKDGKTDKKGKGGKDGKDGDGDPKTDPPAKESTGGDDTPEGSDGP